jgi:hypothetical protein
MPSVNEPTNPAAISAGRSAAADGVTTTVFTVPISAKTGITSGREAASRHSARPPASDPVKPTARTAG